MAKKIAVTDLKKITMRYHVKSSNVYKYFKTKFII